MELLELVKRRYSCRNYQPTSKEKMRKTIEEIVK